LEFFNTCWKTRSILLNGKELWSHQYLQKGNRMECSNCRDISLLNSSYKIYAKIISNRVNKIAEGIIKEE
jgi:hypothetical protein